MRTIECSPASTGFHEHWCVSTTSRHAHFIIRGSARQGRAEQRGLGQGLSDSGAPSPQAWPGRDPFCAHLQPAAEFSSLLPPPPRLCASLSPVRKGGALPGPSLRAPSALFIYDPSCRIGQTESQGQPETQRTKAAWVRVPGAEATHVQIYSLFSRAPHPHGVDGNQSGRKCLHAKLMAYPEHTRRSSGDRLGARKHREFIITGRRQAFARSASVASF